jgi:hypothetical protein
MATLDLAFGLVKALRSGEPAAGDQRLLQNILH